MIIKQIRIIYALSYKNTISYISNLCTSFSFIIESNCITYLLTNRDYSLLAHTICHTYSSHTSRLSTNYFNLTNRLNSSFSILLYQMLILQNTFFKCLGIYHILWKLSRFSWTCITCNDNKIFFTNQLLYLFFILKYRQSFSEFS